MTNYSTAVRKIALYITAIMAAICIFTAIASFRLENTLFNTNLHIKLLSRYSIYSLISDKAKSYVEEYKKSLNTNKSKGIEEQEKLVSLFNNTLTPEMIKYNINSTLENLLSYFKNETRFLPDIYLKPMNVNSETVIQGNSGENNTTIEKSLSGIDKINLGVILMYIGRTDITDKLMVVKLFQFALSKLPLTSIFLLFLCLLIGLFLSKEKKMRILWFKVMSAVSGLIFLISGIFVHYFLYTFFPGLKESSTINAVISAGTINGYLKSLLSPTSYLLCTIGILAMITVPLYRINIKSTEYKPDNSNCRKNSLGLIIGTALFVIVFLLSVLQFEQIKNEFQAKDLNAAIDRMKGITAFSRVVYAQDAAIYSLEIRLVDRKTEEPVKGIQMNISGVCAKKGESFNEYKISDMEGKAKALLDIGSFKIDFDPGLFPKDYIIPSTYCFDIDKAGTTVLTIALDRTDEKKTEPIESPAIRKDDSPASDHELILGNNN